MIAYCEVTNILIVCTHQVFSGFNVIPVVIGEVFQQKLLHQTSRAIIRRESGAYSGKTSSAEFFGFVDFERIALDVNSIQIADPREIFVYGAKTEICLSSPI
jgi:hypothetical protein